MTDEWLDDGLDWRVMADDGSSATDAVLGFLGGAAIGAVVGLLFAPQGGAETRESLTRRLRDLKARFTADESDWDRMAQELEEV